MRLLTAAFLVVSCLAGLVACTDRSGSVGLLPSTAVRHTMDNGGGIPGKGGGGGTPTPGP